MDLGRIPFTAVIEYARLYDIEDREDFLYYIRIMDDTLLDLESKRAKRETTNGGNKTGKKN